MSVCVCMCVCVCVREALFNSSYHSAPISLSYMSCIQLHMFLCHTAVVELACVVPLWKKTTLNATYGRSGHCPALFEAYFTEISTMETLNYTAEAVVWLCIRCMHHMELPCFLSHGISMTLAWLSRLLMTRHEKRKFTGQPDNTGRNVL